MLTAVLSTALFMGCSGTQRIEPPTNQLTPAPAGQNQPAPAPAPAKSEAAPVVPAPAPASVNANPQVPAQPVPAGEVTISGAVKSTSGKMVSGAQVTCGKFSAMTNDMGTFRLDVTKDLTPPLLNVTAPGFVMLNYPITEKKDSYSDLEILLTETQIVGNVFEKTSPGAGEVKRVEPKYLEKMMIKAVELLPGNKKGIEKLGEFDANGGWVIKGAPNGELSIVVSSPYFCDYADAMSFKKEATKRDVVLVMNVLSIQVMNAVDYKPVAGVKCSVNGVEYISNADGMVVADHVALVKDGVLPCVVEQDGFKKYSEDLKLDRPNSVKTIMLKPTGEKKPAKEAKSEK
jgi:hypothetical protein